MNYKQTFSREKSNFRPVSLEFSASRSVQWISISSRKIVICHYITPIITILRNHYGTPTRVT